METKIGKNEIFLYESDKLSYTDTYFKVMTFTQKNKIKSGSIVKAKVIAVNNGKLQVKV